MLSCSWSQREDDGAVRLSRPHQAPCGSTIPAGRAMSTESAGRASPEQPVLASLHSHGLGPRLLYALGSWGCCLRGL